MKTIKRMMKTVGKVLDKITYAVGYAVLVYTMFWIRLGFIVVDKIKAGIGRLKKVKAV